MNYTWRLFKYSKLVENQDDKLSYCKHNMESISQTITHSQLDSQGIKKEQWLHIYMESNRFIEITLYNRILEIKLCIHNPPNIRVTKLENINLGSSVRMCLKGRVLAFKFVDSKKKFQVVFFNSDEANIFFNKLNLLIEVNTEDKKLYKELKQKFLENFKNKQIDEDVRKNMQTNKNKIELIQEFLKLIKD
ncbi:hypothetical protein NCER_101249 [Vairimorpha ceranae BRL01]|uniref:Uncharacterized protein n=2 Tax=Vairimorpha ceranae TaxID=40302 RepID=C4V9K0_VAIC1|nr:hypothetical protein AAJ76_3200025379 [Vairimorpha ceranae]EEQ82103.1 hypothetical protein NCER_101249 [Vairimorpha ceranae BRL01]KAF5141097.1 hypothetical protein G9O61_00g007880 [Vairimorpha ceranae]KKO75108.1 hypothetical protein AAJ76_3200025379 [Vairimorpha ceranae]